MRTVSRRNFIGAGLLVAAGTGAVAAGQTSRGRRWLHNAGVLDGPDLDRPGGGPLVRTDVLQSGYQPRAVRYALAVPRGDVEVLLVCLHGRGGDERFPFHALGVHEFVAGRQLPWAVVASDGGEAYWHPRRDGRAPDAALFDELLPALSARLGTPRVALLGWSMGGYGALLAAARRSGAFAAVAATSSALWRSPAEAAAGAFDDTADFRAHDVFSSADVLRGMSDRVRIDCGDDDPFVRANRELAALLPRAERSFGPGFHDSGTWRSRLPGQLDFLERAVGAAAGS